MKPVAAQPAANQNLQQFYTSPVNTDLRYDQVFAQARAADISVTTKEGDKVTISQSSYEQQQLHRIESAYTSSLAMSSLEMEGFSLQVEGDLSEQELADLSSLLEDLSDIAADFFSGDLAGAFTGALSMPEMGSSLYSMDASFTETTLLASYMQAGHPMPSAFDPQFLEEFDRPDDDTRLADINTIMSDKLKAQWQQFIEQLDQDDDDKPETPKYDDGVEIDESHGKSMYARAVESLEKHPRLAPLLPSVGELAVDRTADWLQAAQESRDALKKDFMDQFASWLV